MKRRFIEWIVNAPNDIPTAADRVEHCDICDWATICDDERRTADHLSLVATIGRNHRRALANGNITTLEMLATMPIPPAPPIDIKAKTLHRIQGQAEIQLRGRRIQKPLYDLLAPITPEQGLAALPQPSDGDLFFDLEGDPYALGDGSEYLFGYNDRNGQYSAVWSLDREQEKRAFEEFIDMVMRRIGQYPDMHIYRYAPYEPTALKRLMGRYATREDEVDRLLRGKYLVDLYRVVRQGMRASVESYSIKKMEPYYGYRRDVDLRDARSALSKPKRFHRLPKCPHNPEGRDSVPIGYCCNDIGAQYCLPSVSMAEFQQGEAICPKLKSRQLKSLIPASGTFRPRKSLEVMPDASRFERHTKWSAVL